jgi:hypothetical protein
MKTVALFGTSHSYQVPDSAESEFRAAIEKACLNRKIRSIGEEFCAQELINRNIDVTICEQIANRFGIPHRYCDLNDEEREKLGVRHENLIRSQGWLLGWEQERIEREVRASHSIRERHWLYQILGLNCWPTLFVCGANHVLPFRKLLDANGITVQVIESDWEPRRMKRRRAATHFES